MEQVQEAPSTVVLNSLKALRLETAKSTMDLLSFLHVPSLECLELLLGWGSVSMVPEVIGTLCGGGVVKLRHLHILEGRRLSQDRMSGPCWVNWIVSKL